MSNQGFGIIENDIIRFYLYSSQSDFSRDAIHDRMSFGFIMYANELFETMAGIEV